MSSSEITNTININELPTLTTLEETDRIYVFKNRDDKTILDEIPISELSIMFYGKEFLERFNEKYNELLQLSADFLKFLNESFPTSAFIENNIATNEYFTEVYSEMAYKSKLKEEILEDYTPRVINEKFKQKAMKEHEEMKKSNLDSSTGSVIFGI
jgi:hypothetical protein